MQASRALGAGPRAADFRWLGSARWINFVPSDRTGRGHGRIAAGAPGIPRSLAKMPQLNRSDRVRGCLLGLAVGDALGAPLEGLSSQQIRAHYGTVDDYVDGVRAWKKKPYRWRLPG